MKTCKHTYTNVKSRFKTSSFARSLLRAYSVRAFVLLMLLPLWGCDGASSGTNDYRPGFLYEDKYSALDHPFGLSIPVVLVETPANGTIIPKDIKEITVKGLVEPGDNLITGFLVNDEAVEIEADGSFNTIVSLPDDGNRFACIEFVVLDSQGYSGRERIAILRGDPVSSKELPKGSMGLCFQQSLAEWIVTAVNPWINEILYMDDYMDTVFGLVTGLSVPIDIIEPEVVTLELSVDNVSLLDDREVQIKALEIKDPEIPKGAACLLGDMSFRGLEIDIGVKMTGPFGNILFENKPMTVKVRIPDDMRILADACLSAPDQDTIDLDMINMDIDINEMEISFPDSNIFKNNSIKINKGLAWLINLLLSRILDTMMDMGVSMPNAPVNLGLINNMLDGLRVPILKGQDPLDIGSMINADFSDMYLAYGIGGFFGDADRFGASVDLTAWAYGHDEVIYLPPSISIEDALKPSQQTEADLAVAVSGDFLNRMVGALAGIEPEFFLPVNEALPFIFPDLKLPDNTRIKATLHTPPVITFNNGEGVVSIPNLFIELYMDTLDDSGLQAQMAIDVKASVQADLFFHEGEYYLDFDLVLPTFNVFFMVDRMGISQVVNFEELMVNLMPQVIDLLRGLLDVPMKISSSDMAGFLPNIPLPEATVTLPEIRMEGGYVSMFVHVE